MNYLECKNMCINLKEFGANRQITIEELVNEVIKNRRERFFDELFSLRDSEVSYAYCFDAITFNSVILDFEQFFDSNPRHKNYEGTIEYFVVAGGDWIWNCKTTITWCNALPMALGKMKYHTDIISTSGVNDYINGVTGTSMKIVMKANNLKIITFDEALRRSRESING